jgi:carbamoyltransferase
MLVVANVRPDKSSPMTEQQQQLWGIEKLNVVRSEIPAVTHIDYSARVQTVDAAVAPRYHRLIQEFKRLTGVGVLVNTSFNVRGEPIVESPAGAYQCFMRTEIDALVLENCLLYKNSQPPLRESGDWRAEFGLD